MYMGVIDNLKRQLAAATQQRASMPDAEAEHLQQIFKDRGISTDMQRLPQEAHRPMLDTFRKADATRRHKGPEAAQRLIRVELRDITAEAMAEERLIDAKIEEAEEARRRQSTWRRRTEDCWARSQLS